MYYSRPGRRSTLSYALTSLTFRIVSVNAVLSHNSALCAVTGQTAG
jgi:hypothetical protein